MNTTLSITSVLAGCLSLGALVSAPGTGDPARPAQVGLMQLREDFHLAASLGDYDMMLGLWTEDAEFHAGPNHIYGARNIVDFLSSSPLWGRAVNLTSESKTHFDVQGKTAAYAFECIIVRVDGSRPLETSLSSIPYGNQNPNVEIVQHSNTAGTAVREDGRWKFAIFNGAPGPN